MCKKIQIDKTSFNRTKFYLIEVELDLSELNKMNY